MNPHSINDPDNKYMKRALDLARLGAGLVSPNPMVGAVIVKDGRVTGEGFHRYDLIKHAEVHALEMAGDAARGATLYCSLEPCCHYGRTPPCTDAMIEAGIAKAVVATIDPNPRVNGRGVELLRNAGMTVEVGLCESESRRINEIYIKFVTSRLPFTHLVIASNLEEWIPSEAFVEIASHYDTIRLSDSSSLNNLIVEKLMQRDRHRTLRLMATDENAIPDSIRANAEGGKVMLLTSNETSNSVERSPERSEETSILILPGFVDASSDHINRADKVTIVHTSQDDLSANVIGSVDVITATSNLIETTGYPRREEQSKTD